MKNLAQNLLDFNFFSFEFLWMIKEIRTKYSVLRYAYYTIFYRKLIPRLPLQFVHR